MAKNGKPQETDYVALMRDVMAAQRRFIEQAQSEIKRFEGQMEGLLIASGWSAEEANEKLGEDRFRVVHQHPEPAEESAEA